MSVFDCASARDGTLVPRAALAHPDDLLADLRASPALVPVGACALCRAPTLADACERCVASIRAATR